MGFLGFLGLLFIALKLTNVITWSWVFVLLPLYGPIVAALGIWLITLAGMSILYIVLWITERITK